MAPARPQNGDISRIPIEFRVFSGTLDPVDIPVGPWGYTINVPWIGGDEIAEAHNAKMSQRSLEKMREYGFTTFSGVPTIVYCGFQDGKPVLDFSMADRQMELAKELGFLAVISYGSGVCGYNPYYNDTGQMTAAGFKDYGLFVAAIYSAIQHHANEEGWLPVYYNLGDEPVGDDLRRSLENAQSYMQAFPKGPPWFTAASSFRGGNAEDPHFLLSKSLHVTNWNSHDTASVNLLRQSGGNWAFYNGGNRWTFGVYMYKAVREFDMKFRVAWHWNCAAGDPYYALDCREDDYSWCNSSPDGRLIPTVRFERLREGLDDYRRMSTLARLAEEQASSPQARDANRLLEERLAAFKLGDRDHDTLWGVEDWKRYRRKLNHAIDQFK